MATPGPWALRGRQIRAEGGVGKHVADYMVDAEDGRLIAAAPELRDLLEEFMAIFGKGVIIAPELIKKAETVLTRIEKKEPWED